MTQIKDGLTKGHADDKYNNMADDLACQASAIEQKEYLMKIKGL